MLYSIRPAVNLNLNLSLQKRTCYSFDQLVGLVTVIAFLSNKFPYPFVDVWGLQSIHCRLEGGC